MTLREGEEIPVADLSSPLGDWDSQAARFQGGSRKQLRTYSVQDPGAERQLGASVVCMNDKPPRP